MKSNRRSRLFVAGVTVLLLAFPSYAAFAEVFITPAKLTRTADHLLAPSGTASEAYTRAKERQLELADGGAAVRERSRVRRPVAGQNRTSETTNRYFEFKQRQAEMMDRSR